MAILPTFADFVRVNGIPEDPDLSEFDRVTVAWLHYHEAVLGLVGKLKADPRAGDNLRGLLDVLSEDIIDTHLGSGWYQQHVDRSGFSRQSRTYLDLGADPTGRLLAAHRVHELARRLYQLQSFGWFDRVASGLRTRDLSGAGFELDVVMDLHRLIASVSPTHETGRRGEDYDIHLEMYGLAVPIEVKAKADDTPFTRKTIVSTIKQATSQLPKGSQGVIFLRIPSAWVGRDLEETLPDILAEATRQTSRVGAIVTVIDKMHLNREQTAGHVTRHRHFFRHPNCPDSLWTACLHLKETLERDWTILAPEPPF